jgi:hypothetical protein
MSDDEKKQLLQSLIKCWSKYKEIIGGDEINFKDGIKISQKMELYLSLL